MPEANRNYYQQLLDITLLREIDGQLIELKSFYHPKSEKSLQSACEAEFRRRYNKLWGRAFPLSRPAAR